jgi:hypothetical protein
VVIAPSAGARGRHDFFGFFRIRPRRPSRPSLLFLFSSNWRSTIEIIKCIFSRANRAVIKPVQLAPCVVVLKQNVYSCLVCLGYRPCVSLSSARSAVLILAGPFRLFGSGRRCKM